MRWWVVLVVACASPKVPPKPVELPRASIDVTASDCIASDTQARIAGVLAAHGAERSDLVVRVTDVDHTLRLVVSRATGIVGVDREYPLAPVDCASSGELLALGVDRFLSAFPEWAGPPPAPPPPPPPRERWVAVTARGAVSSLWMPFGVDGQAGAVVDLGGARDRIGVSALVRASVPQAAGDGHFQQTAVLAGAAYRRRLGAWQLHGELRAGAVRVAGSGFTENATDWLAWWEVAAYAGYSLGWGSAGIEVAATALHDHAITRDGLVREDIPMLRLGLAIEFKGLSNR